jgi:class III poly(R)-hydroxyalkanoic acid synthase PhaE subunit
VESFRHAPGHLGQAITGNGSELIELTNLYWDAFERTFGRLLESPSMGYTRELHAKLLKGFDAWLDFRRASFEYQVMLADAWARAFEQLMQELVTLAEKGERIQSLRQLLGLWVDVADRVFMEEFRSEAYNRVQGQLVNTVMAYRLREQEIVETFMKISNLPTRSEMDEAHRTIYELRKEVKALRKALREADSQAPAQAKQQTKPKRRPARRKPAATPEPTNSATSEE